MSKVVSVDAPADRVAEPDQWSLEDQATWWAGFSHGLNYPSLLFHIHGEKLSTSQAKALANGLIDAVDIAGLADDWRDGKGGTKQQDEFASIVELLLKVINRVQQNAGLPVFETGRVIKIAEAEASIVVPTAPGTYQLVANLMNWLVNCCRLIRAGQPLANHGLALVDLVERLRSNHGYHSVEYQFIGAALRNGIPFVQLAEKIVEYGQGHLARRMRDSLTDVTSNISVHLGRSKHGAAQVLREAGIPVPAHFLVTDLEQAHHAAQQLGLPVVTKPADLDGGLAVSADLHSPREVERGFAKAVAVSKLVLVEKHVPGRDYRITVFQGKPIWAVERVPGGVTGDGKSTVRELVAHLNLDPRRQAGAHAALKPLPIDDEALGMLQRAGMSEESVPPSGSFVRLRRAANVASGGMPVAVFDRLHPDNAQLAVRAAAAIGADIAGVDLLIPDIAESWHDSGAFICEVNPGPDIGQSTAAHLYEPLLVSQIKGNGRIPIVLVVGAQARSALEELIDRGFSLPGMTVGYHGRSGVRIGHEWLSKVQVRSYFAGQMLVRDHRVEAMVVQAWDEDLTSTGLPFPRFDILVVGGDVTRMNDSGANPGGPGGGDCTQELLGNLLPACDGNVLVLEGCDDSLGLGQFDAGMNCQYGVSVEDLDQVVSGLIREKAAAHLAALPAMSDWP